MPTSLPSHEETLAKYCVETGAQEGDVLKKIEEFAKQEGITNNNLATRTWVIRQGKEPPPLLDAVERCFFDDEHWEPAKIHDNADGSRVVLCKRHEQYLCKSHTSKKSWVIGTYGFSLKGSKDSEFQWLWFCEEHKPNRKGLSVRRPQLKAQPYTPKGWKWDAGRGVQVKV
jgi:hypothetical protein